MIRARTSSLLHTLALCLFALLCVAALVPARAPAIALGDDDNAEWRVEQPVPPTPAPGVEDVSTTPIGLGDIGDIEFWSPNRGALITSGNGSTIPPGVWFYDGDCEGTGQSASCAAGWRELSSVCGATDGRIAWAGENEFWTISDGRPGQAYASPKERPPLEDDTLCHFAPPPGEPQGPLEVVASYASPAFESTSYQAMHAAGCISSTDCWFAGAPLPEPQIGAFQLHWNGDTLEAEPYLPEGHTVWDMREFEGRLFESPRLLTGDHVVKVLRRPPPLRVINPPGVAPLFEPIEEMPLYKEKLEPGSEEEEFSYALDYLHLSADRESSLWAAAGPQLETPPGSEPAGVTVVRKAAGVPVWRQVIGPSTTPSGRALFPEDVLDSLAAEPGTESAWIALDTKTDAGDPSPLAQATVARVAADGSVSDELSLPVSGERIGAKGAAKQIVCPAAHDCWMTTEDGWLVHLATASERESGSLDLDTDPVFSDPEPIVTRPPDQGLPQLPSDAPPSDDSGLEEPSPPTGNPVLETREEHLTTVSAPLLSDVHSRLVHGTTLELRFHLAVRARVRLVAKHRASVVASTATRTLQAGNRDLRVRLNLHRWPTKLELQTHALAPLPTRSVREVEAE